MSKFIIKGGKSLKGKIKVPGAKNAALPIIAATLLTDKKCEISNVPKIGDVYVMLEILKRMGSVFKFRNHTVVIQNKNINPEKLDEALVGKMRASILLTGPLLARFGKTKVHYPGGCLIGARPIDTHIEALQGLGAKIKIQKKNYDIQLSVPKNKKVILKEISVTATENILMACALSPYTCEIRLSAIEPEVVNLADFLMRLGVKIEGKGTPYLKVSGKKKLKGAKHKIIPDRIEAATLVALAAATKSFIKIENIDLSHLDSLINILKVIGVHLKKGKNYLTIKPSNELKGCYIRTDVYPGFATDFQAPMSVLLTQAEGKSIIFETLFENRLGYIKELVKMGAQAKLKDLHRVELMGPSNLFGTKIKSLDIRAGVTLVIAALCASGTSEIDNIELIDRGYEDIDKRLKKLGADIIRIKKD